jgi:peptide/nickel transport system substrate-binding protein
MNRGAVVAALSALVLAACGGGSGSPANSSSSSASGNSANQNASGQPTSGGTLNLLGSGDVDHLDTASAYYAATYTLERAYSRQLVSYPTSPDITTANGVVADVAREVPTVANGGVSSDGLTYTFHLRSGVMWNTTPPRAVTSQDFLLGLKRLCNPVSPVGAPGYYTATIAGFSDYCDPFTKLKGAVVATIKAYILGHEISGITTPDASTIVFKLTKPASDFVNILALPFASAAPVEYLGYLPDDATFKTHTISDGPYQVVKYVAAAEIDFDKNPAWSQGSDPLRHQYVDHIKVTEGQDQNAVQQQLEAGTADMQFDTVVPTAEIPRLRAASDARLGAFLGGDTNPYLLFNFQSPNNGGALKNVKVRQALEYAIDKTAIVQTYGGPSIGTPLNQVIPPGSLGYEQFNLYPTPGDKGDPAKCKSMLKDAGYPNGIVLNDVFRNAGKHPAVYQIVKQDFGNCGVTVNGVSSTQGDYYAKYLSNVDAAKAGVWDISEPGWVPDWFGNNGRAITEPLFDGRSYGPNATDYGDYNSPTTNGYIDQALSATSTSDAAKYWHMADMQIMQDAAFIPFKTEKIPLFHSTRVHNAIYSPFSQQYDLTQIWLNPAT